MLAALVAMRGARGAAELGQGEWRAGGATFAYALGKRLLREDLVEPVFVDQDGVARRLELNLRGHELLQRSDVLLRDAR